jgi:hypothetical protein
MHHCKSLLLCSSTNAEVLYHLKSNVSQSGFQEFVSLLEGTTVKVTNNNFRGLSQLCDKFGFRDLAGQLSQFGASDDFKKEAEVQNAIPMTEIHHSGTLFAEWFMFTSENAIFECSVGQAVALSAVGANSSRLMRVRVLLLSMTSGRLTPRGVFFRAMQFQSKDREMDWGGNFAVLVSNWRWQGLIVLILIRPTFQFSRLRHWTRFWIWRHFRSFTRMFFWSGF